MEERIIYFDEALHKYTDEFNNPYISCTTILKNYVNEFDTKYMARVCALKGQQGNPKYAGKSAAQLEAEWTKTKDDACEKGTVKHDFLEQIVKNSTNYTKTIGTNFIKGRLYTIKDIIRNPEIGRVNLEYFQSCGLDTKYPVIYNLLSRFIDSGYFLYSEICAYNSDFLISGLIDILAVKGNNFAIIDWKTNRAPIKFEAGFWTKDMLGNLSDYRQNGNTFKTPLKHLADSVGNHYTMQLSIYDYLVEGFGLNCLSNVLCHIRPTSGILGETEEEVVVLPIKYLKSEVQKMFNHHDTVKGRKREFQYIIGH